MSRAAARRHSLARSGNLERQQLAVRLLQVAPPWRRRRPRTQQPGSRPLKTLATSLALYLTTLRPSMPRPWQPSKLGRRRLPGRPRHPQAVSKPVPWGRCFRRRATGNRAAVVETRQPQVVPSLRGRREWALTFNVDIPIIRRGKVRYVLLLGLNPEHLLAPSRVNVAGWRVLSTRAFDRIRDRHTGPGAGARRNSARPLGKPGTPTA